MLRHRCRLLGVNYSLPENLFLIRHGESDANVNTEVYSNTPDWKIPLTKRGREQASRCGKELRHRIGPTERVSFYYSPYWRTQQTFQGISQHFSPEQLAGGVREDARLREQEMGNYQPKDGMKKTWGDRTEQGRFFYRFSDGENGADVCDRVSSFLDTMFRERETCAPEFLTDHVIIVTHGLALRLFIARWFKMPLQLFDTMYNPPNGGIIQLKRSNETKKLIMTKESEAILGMPDDDSLLMKTMNRGGKLDSADMSQYYLNDARCISQLMNVEPITPVVPP
eukprot:Tbor_TRINITY_DN3088_c0_g1::TRINITY_DN3088_c0_g1_i1::g.17416::m.17416